MQYNIFCPFGLREDMQKHRPKITNSTQYNIFYLLGLRGEMQKHRPKLKNSLQYYIYTRTHILTHQIQKNFKYTRLLEIEGPKNKENNKT